MFIVPKVLEITMYNGILKETGERIGPETGEMKDFKTYEDFMAAFKTQLYHFMGMYNEEHNILIRVTREVNCDVVHSAFTYDGIKSGKDMMCRKMPYENASMMNPIGMVCVANSMAAIKKVVFEDKACTIGEMFEVLKANWDGHEDLRLKCEAAPKFGNGIDFVDDIVAELYKFWCDSANSFRSVYGEPPRPTGISITAYAPGGSYTGATPDGRLAGTVLPDGCASPAQGTDTEGPTISLGSAMKINQDPFNAMLLNMKMHPSALKSEEDLMKLASLVKVYLTNGGKHIQFNVVDNETLRDAQKHPENYRDLVVRVAGYSAYFNYLTKAVQDEIISRSENKMV